ncbi:MAG: hypothetical protein IPL40_02795 [Proteobacteria bacterium]|nr:hypothetical protein [Pseudomonadota bacterium]
MSSPTRENAARQPRSATEPAKRLATTFTAGWGSLLVVGMLLGGCGDQQLISARSTPDADSAAADDAGSRANDGGESCSGQAGVGDDCDCRLGESEACYPGLAEHAGVGACERGTRTCTSGPGGLGSRWSDCADAVSPAASDTCGDAIDNDCDGTADEGCPPVTFADVCDVGAANTYVEAAIDPASPSTWYVLDHRGAVARTLDDGASFTVLCRVPAFRGGERRSEIWALRNEARLLISPASDHTAYLALDDLVLRIDPLGPSVDCPTVSEPGTYSPSDGFSGGPCALSASSGELFIWTRAMDGSDWMNPREDFGQLRKSSDGGRSWTPVAADPLAMTTHVRSLAVDPASPEHLLALTTDGDRSGIYETSAGGAWTKRSALTLYAEDLPPAIHFDPVATGHAYVDRGGSSDRYGPYGDGFHSTDGGATWQVSAGHAAPLGESVINPTNGAAFRFREAANNGGMVIERAPSLSVPNPAWTTVASFPSGLDRFARIDAAGQRVLAVVGLRLWVSRDGGQSFTGPLGGGLPVTFGFSALDSVDGQTFYATSPEWHVLRSTDQGARFSRVFTNSTTLGTHQRDVARLRVYPAQPDIAIVWAGRGSGNDPSVIRTSDAFQSAALTQEGATSYAGSLLALSVEDPASAFLFRAYDYPVRIPPSAGPPWTELTDGTPLPPPVDAWVLPGQASTQVLVTATQWAGRYIGALRYDASTQDYVDDTAALSAALGDEHPAGLEAFKRGASVIFRLIGVGGRLAESTDGGATFHGIAGAKGGLGPCPDRRIASLASDRNVLASWCSSHHTALYYSRNGGRDWAMTGGTSWQELACADVWDLAVGAEQLITLCRPDPILRHNRGTRDSHLIVRVPY